MNGLQLLALFIASATLYWYATHDVRNNMQKSLSDVMEFDHVIMIDADLNVIDSVDSEYAPTLTDHDLDSTEWTLMNGYSGQYGAPGPIMHNSEFIGGRMERDIRETPGYYVAIVAHWSVDSDPDENGEYADADDIEGWAVAYKPL